VSSLETKRTIAVDWDGTLVEYHGFKGACEYGAPIPKMVARVKEWIAKGHEVLIYTSRVSIEHGFDRIKMESDSIQYALHEMGLPPLQVTATKWMHIAEFWDDRAVQVEINTGRRM